jgi:acyl-CoA thioester hydrolase
VPLRVRCHECDGQGTVSNANDLAYVDMASLEVESALFGSHADFLAHGVEVVVAEANLRYLVPCRFEDDLVVTRSSGTSGLSVVLDFEIHRGKQRVIGPSGMYSSTPRRGGGPLRPNGCQPDVGTPGL